MRHRFPVRVRQHEVIDQVVERLTLDRYVQACHVREVRCAQPPGVMHLTEKHFLLGTFGSAPPFHASLKRSQLSILKPTWVLPLQPLKKRLRLQTGI